MSKLEELTEQVYGVMARWIDYHQMPVSYMDVLRAYEECESRVHILTGYNFPTLEKMFAAGWTLKPPDPALTMSQLVAMFEEG